MPKRTVDYDIRNLPAGDTSTLPTDGGRTFGNEKHLARSFDLKTAPNAEGYFIGDYSGLDARGTAFLPFFVQTNSGNTANPTDVFASP